MKKTLLFLSALAFVLSSASAQTFSTLITDPSGDNLNGVPDIKTVSYDMNVVKDSIWFKIVTYNIITDSMDFGFVIGLDTDMNVNNGHAWEGSNTSMKYDQGLFIMQDDIMPGYRYSELGIAGSTTHFNAHITHPDNYTWIINAQLSKLDRDHKFNIITGGASFDCAFTPGSVYDDAPNTGYKTITAPGAVPSVTKEQNISVYPNPANDVLIISSKETIKGFVAVYDLTGRVMLKEPVNQMSVSIPVKKLANSRYLYAIIDENGNTIQTGSFSVNH